MYKSFYEQVFLRTRFNKGLQERPSSVGSAIALLQVKWEYSRLRRGILTRFAIKELFSYESFNSLSAKSVLAGENS